MPVLSWAPAVRATERPPRWAMAATCARKAAASWHECCHSIQTQSTPNATYAAATAGLAAQTTCPIDLAPRRSASLKSARRAFCAATWASSPAGGDGGSEMSLIESEEPILR